MSNESAAEKAAAEKAAKKTKLIPVTKDGDTIKVHPSQVEQHKGLGWSVKK